MRKQVKKQWIMMFVLIILSSSFLFFISMQDSSKESMESSKVEAKFNQKIASIANAWIQLANDTKTEKKQTQEIPDTTNEPELEQTNDAIVPNDSVPKEEIQPTPPNQNATSPVEKPEEQSFVTIRIDASNIIANMDKVSPAVTPFIPKDGIVLANTQIALQENDTVFSVLQRACEQQGISLDATNGYVRYLHDFGEFDAGNTSGWLYTVNGSMKSIGAAAYKVNKNDVIVWHYTVVQGDVS